MLRKQEENRVKALRTMALLALVGATVAACDQPLERSIETPFARSFNWFAYVGGDDIRSTCAADGRSQIGRAHV